MIDQIFVSPQGKQSVIISSKTGIYELPQDSPNDLRFRILGNIRKISKLKFKLKFLSISKSLLKNRNWTFPVMHYFTWKPEYASNILWMIVGLVPSNFDISLLFLIFQRSQVLSSATREATRVQSLLYSILQ